MNNQQKVIQSVSISILTIMLMTSFSLSGVRAETAVTDAELATDTSTASDSSEVIRFTLRVRWGFVRGNPDNDRTEKIYDGSVSSSNFALAKIKLNRTLLFENHDSSSSQADSVSWKSKIYSHWDGVLINIWAKTNVNITVITERGIGITKTAKEWFELSEPAVLEYGNNEMLVVNTYPQNRRRQAVLIWWGRAKNISGLDITSCENYTYSNCPNQCKKICLPSVCSGSNICSTDCDGPKSCYNPKVPPVNFSGTLTMNSDAYIKLKKTLRLEKNDRIDEHDRNHITWTSYITTGRDGLFTLMIPTKNVTLNSGFNIIFPNVNDAWSKSYTFQDVKEGIRETITVDGVDYILAVGHKKIPKLLVRAKKNRKLYLIKDNILHQVTDNDILEANGYQEDNAVEMDDDELASYAKCDNLNYPDGIVLVKVEGDTAVWRLRSGKRQVFNNAKIFDLHRLDWNKVKTISQEKLLSYSWNSPVEYPDGSLVKVPTDPKVYLISNGKRHWIETEKDFLGLGYKFSDIKDMPVTEIVNYLEGDPVIADEAEEVIEF